MQETPNYKLPLYEMDDMANLNDGYNNAMNTIDAALQQQKENFKDKFPLQSTDLDNGIVTNSKMAANAIDTVNIVDGAVTNAKLAANSVETDNIVDGAVTGAKIANGSINNDMLDNDLANSIGDIATNKTLVEEHVNYFAELGVTDEQSATDLHTQIDNTYQTAMNNTETINELKNATVPTSKLEDGAVTLPKIASNAIDSTPTSGSDNLVTSGGVAAALENVSPTPTSKSSLAVYIGNSYTKGDSSTTTTDGLFELTKDRFGSAYQFYEGGAGFSAYSGHTKTFNNLVNDASISADFDNNDVTDVIFISAMGDTRAACASTDMALGSTMNNVRSKFPNARIFVYFAEITGTKTIQSSYSVLYPIAQLRVHQELLAGASLYGYTYLGWGGWAINFDSSYNASDNYHPNDTGYKYLANFLNNSLNGIVSYPERYFTVNEGGSDYGSVWMSDPLHGSFTTLALKQSAHPNMDQNAFKVYNIFDTTSDVTMPVAMPTLWSHSITFAVFLSSGVNNKFSAGTYNTLVTSNGSIALEFNAQQSITPSDTNVSRYYGSGVTAPIDMRISRNLSFDGKLG